MGWGVGARAKALRQQEHRALEEHEETRVAGAGKERGAEGAWMSLVTI